MRATISRGEGREQSLPYLPSRGTMFTDSELARFTRTHNYYHTPELEQELAGNPHDRMLYIDLHPIPLDEFCDLEQRLIEEAYKRGERKLPSLLFYDQESIMSTKRVLCHLVPSGTHQNAPLFLARGLQNAPTLLALGNNARLIERTRLFGSNGFVPG